MSKVNAYICNYCGSIREEHCILGILPQENLLDRLESYPFTLKLNGTNTHGCVQCLDELISKIDIDRRKWEAEYKDARKTVIFSFRQQCVTNRVQKTYTSIKEAGITGRNSRSKHV